MTLTIAAVGRDRSVCLVSHPAGRAGGRRVRILTLVLAEGPVQEADGVGGVRGADGAGAVQGHADDGVAVPGRLEQQALPGGPRVAGLDADRARVMAEQRVEVLPQVGVVPR